MFGLHCEFFFTKRRMHAWSTKRSLFAKPFLHMSVTFRDESNEPSSIIIGYSDATVIAPNHHLIIRSKISLATATATEP